MEGELHKNSPIEAPKIQKRLIFVMAYHFYYDYTGKRRLRFLICRQFCDSTVTAAFATVLVDIGPQYPLIVVVPLEMRQQYASMQIINFGYLELAPDLS